jgi:hypothetical protein
MNIELRKIDGKMYDGGMRLATNTSSGQDVAIVIEFDDLAVCELPDGDGIVAMPVADLRKWTSVEAVVKPDSPSVHPRVNDMAEEFKAWFESRHTSVATSGTPGALKEGIRIMCLEAFEAGYKVSRKSVLLPGSPVFVFDVESVGLHGEGFAVAGGVYVDGAAQSEFRFCCPPGEAEGSDEDRKWIDANVPAMEITHRGPASVRDAFWTEWEKAKARHPKIVMAGECIWPVEAGFVAACVCQKLDERKWSGPYPFHEISSVMFAAGMDPMAAYVREESEKPAHEPLADARLSARLLATALRKLAKVES